MNFEDEATLSFYRDITNLNNDPHVFLVRHVEDERIYVKKILSLYDEELYYSLKRMKLHGIPKIFHIIKDDDRLIVIEEYINGISLERYMDENGPLSADEAVNIICQLCDILHMLHRTEPPIIHRDIKPSNILISSDNSVSLIDFNAAKKFDREKNKDTVLMGTVDYAAPEQYGFSQSDARTDIYALGILLNVMLTGKTPKEKLYDGKISGIISRCTNMDPNKRYSSAAKLKKSLIAKSKGISGAAAILPPGFRTGKVWKAVPAALYYALTAYISFTLEVEGVDSFTPLMAYRIATFLIFLCPVAVFCNYMILSDRLPLARGTKALIRLAGKLLWTAVFIMVILLLVMVFAG